MDPQDLPAEGKVEVAPDPIPPPPAEAAAPSAPRPDSVRERILERFARWLDEAWTDEGPPPGIAAEFLSEAGEPERTNARCDLYSLWSAMTALAQEVKLQGRTFKELSQTLAPFANLGTSVEAALGAHAQTLSELRAAGEDRDRRVAREAKRSARREILDLLLDVRDRLSRGLQSARAGLDQAKKGLETRWSDRIFPRRRKRVRSLVEAGEALLQGYELSLDRLDEALEEFGVREVDCDGEEFDPHLMKAVELEESLEAPAGTVLEVYRVGYAWDGEVLRPAEVKVARRPSGAERGESE